MNKIYIIGLITLAALTAESSLAKEEIYRWTDEQGRVHFSEKRPDVKKVEKIELKYKAPSQPGSKLDASSIIREYDRRIGGSTRAAGGKKVSNTGQEQVDAGQCELMVANLAALSSGESVEKQDEATGEIIRLNDDARAVEIDYAESYLSIYCAGYEY